MSDILNDEYDFEDDSLGFVEEDYDAPYTSGKTDFKALIENAKAQVNGYDEVSEEGDMFVQLEQVQCTYNILEENELDSTNVQFLEIALVDQIVKESEEVINEADEEKKQGFFGKVWATIVKFIKAIWDFITMKNRDIPKQLQKAEDSLRKRAKKKDADASSLNQSAQACGRVKDHAKKFFGKWAPQMKKYQAQAQATAKSVGKKSKEGGKALKEVKRMKNHIASATTKYHKVITAANGLGKTEKGEGEFQSLCTKTIEEVNKITDDILTWGQAFMAIITADRSLG